MRESGELNWERLTWRFMLVRHRRCKDKGTSMSHEGKVKGKVGAGRPPILRHYKDVWTPLRSPVAGMIPALMSSQPCHNLL